MPGIGEVAIDYVIGQTFDGFQVAACREILKGSDADVTRCDAGQYGPSQLTVAIHGFTGRDGRQRPCGRNSERMHRFANEIFAQDRPNAARPSPRRENGVRPAPFNWTSRRSPLRSKTSPRRIARPSPS
jgi:hypothetical protein